MHYLCIKCGSLNNSEKNQVCLNCGQVYYSDLYDKIYQEALLAVRFGYQYRLAFERQIETQDNIYCYYSLQDTPKWVKDLGMIVLSGIIGGVSYDGIKLSFEKAYEKIIKDKVVETTDKANPSQKNIYIFNDNTTYQFITYIQEYHKGMPQVDKRVKDAIKEEELAEVLSETIEELMKDEKYNSKPLNEIISEALKRINGVEVDSVRPKDSIPKFPYIEINESDTIE